MLVSKKEYDMNENSSKEIKKHRSWGGVPYMYMYVSLNFTNPPRPPLPSKSRRKPACLQSFVSELPVALVLYRGLVDWIHPASGSLDCSCNLLRNFHFCCSIILRQY